MKIFKHTSEENPYGFGVYFCNIPEEKSTKSECDNEYSEILRAALKHYRSEHASRLLHEIAHSIFSSDNPKKTAKIFFCAGEMYALLKKIADKHEICTMSDIYDLLTIIDGKEAD